MSEQASLTEYGVVTTAAPQQTMSDRDLNPGELKARIVVLELATYGKQIFFNSQHDLDRHIRSFHTGYPDSGSVRRKHG